MRSKGDDDDAELITGPRPQRTRGMYKRWMDAVGDVVVHHRGRPEIAPPVFNSNMALMREKYSIEAITNAFVRFAAAVDAGTVSVQGKPAWLVFMRMRERFLVETTERRGDPFDRATGQKPSNPFHVVRRTNNPFRR